MGSLPLRATRGWSAPGWLQVGMGALLVTGTLGLWAQAPAGDDGRPREEDREDARAAVAGPTTEPTSEESEEPEGSEEPEESEESEGPEAVRLEPSSDDLPMPGPARTSTCSERHQVVPANGRESLRHRSVPRETVAQIAHRYDVPPWKLREWNSLAADVDSLARGAKVRLKPRRISPPRERVEYVVQPGDTWWRVAVSHGVDSMDLRSYNWPYRGKMTPGETLQIWIDPLIYDWIQATPGSPLSPEQGLRRGGVGVGSPNDGFLVNGVQIPEGPGYRLRFPKSAYGTTYAVEQFLLAMEILHQHEDEQPLVAVGSMSRPRGGPLGTHQSHQTGRDLDVRLPRRAGVPSWSTLAPSRVNWSAAWRLVQALARTDVEVIFLDYRMQRRISQAARAAGATEEELGALLQYPRGKHARRGLVRHADGHDKHLHVRFRCGPCEVECVE